MIRIKMVALAAAASLALLTFPSCESMSSIDNVNGEPGQNITFRARSGSGDPIHLSDIQKQQLTSIFKDIEFSSVNGRVPPGIALTFVSDNAVENVVFYGVDGQLVGVNKNDTSHNVVLMLIRIMDEIRGQKYRIGQK